MTSILVNSRTRGASDRHKSPPGPGPYRALHTTADTFAREVQIDELAYSAGIDPVGYRLSILQDERLAAVMEAADG